MKARSIHQFLIIGGILIVGIVWETMRILPDQYSITNFPPKGESIIALGDSLTTGVGASSQEHNYVSLLEKRFNISITNKGKSGDTTHDALLRLDDDVLALHPDIVLVLLGSNDYLRQEPRRETFSNLRTIIARIQKEGAVVILIGARGGVLSDTFAKDFTALARETGSVFVPGVLDDIFGNAKFMSDEVHPNDAGYLKMADKIAPELEGVVLAVTKKKAD